MTNHDLIQLYNTKTITLTELALQANSTKDRIRTILKKAGVYVQTKQYNIPLPTEEICELYKQDIDVQTIAYKYNVSIAPIVKILKKANLRKPNQFKSLPYVKYIQLIDYNFFSKKVSECISKVNLAKVLGINYDMVASLYKFHNLPDTNSSVVRSLINQRKALINFSAEEFSRLYYEEHNSLDTIRTKMGVSIGYLRKHVKNEWLLNVRSPGDTRISIPFKNLLLDPSVLHTEVLKFTVKELTIKYQVSYDALRKLLKILNITLPFRATSTAEREIISYISNKLSSDEVICGSRSIIAPYELDIYIPRHKLAIEYCGLYWHSENRGKLSTYHVDKLNMCTGNGIRLITIFEDEYMENSDKVNKRISHALNLFTSSKINARSCIVKVITPSVKNSFLNMYHIQGSDICAISLGLFYGDVLVGVMTFAKPARSRNSKKASCIANIWELNRFATCSNFHVRGAASKLLKYFQLNYEWDTIYSYADRRWSQGDLYYKLGFALTSISKPNYWYLDSKYSKREYRYNYTKWKLVDQGFDKSLTEREIMKLRGYDKIWDCGMLKFTLENKKAA